MLEFKIALIGAETLIAENILQILAERNFPVSELFAVIHNKENISDEKSFANILFRGKQQKTYDLENFDFSQVDLAIFANKNDSIDKKYYSKAIEQGITIIDNSSHFNDDNDVPLIVPEINYKDISKMGRRNIIINPSSCAIQASISLQPLQSLAEINALNIVSFQAVSEFGHTGVNKLAQQTVNILNGQAKQEDIQVAFNVIPQISEIDKNNAKNNIETFCAREIRKILGNDNMEININNIQVPVFFGNFMTINAQLEKEIDFKQLMYHYKQSPGIACSEEGQFMTPATKECDDNMVYISNIQQNIHNKQSFNLWSTTDNLRKGCALNIVQIAEKLIY